MPNALLLHACRPGRIARYQKRIRRRNNGLRKEMKVLEALRKAHPKIPVWFLAIEPASKKFDRMGVDLIVSMKTGFSEPGRAYLQIKSSEGIAHDFKLSHEGSVILVVIILDSDTPDVIRNKVIDACTKERERQLGIPLVS